MPRFSEAWCTRMADLEGDADFTAGAPLLGEMMTLDQFVLSRDEAEILYRAVRFHCFGYDPAGVQGTAIVRKLGDWLEGS